MKILFFILSIVIVSIGSIYNVSAQNAVGNITHITRITQGISAPVRITLDQYNNIYLTDPILKSINKYNISGNLLEEVVLPFSPISVAVNRDNQVFIGNGENGNILKLNTNGTTELFYTGLLFPSSMLFCSDKNLYITDSKSAKILVLDPSGNLVRTIGESILVFPTGIAYDHKNNRIIVAEHGAVSNNTQMKVYIFSLSGDLLNSFGAYGEANGEFFRSQGLTVGRCGNIYITEPVQGYINVFSEDGTFIKRFSQYGETAGDLKVPMDILFDSQERVLMTSLNNGSLEIFNIADSLPSSSLSNSDISVCTGSTANVPVKLTGTAPWSFSYTIDGQDTQLVTNTYTNPHILTVNQSGVLKITALSDSQYPSTCFTESAVVKINPLPTAAITTETISISYGQTALIPVTFTGIGLWNFTYTHEGIPITINNISSNPYILSVTQSGIYELTSVSDANCAGASFTGTTTVINNVLPTSNILSDDTLIQTGSSANILIAFTGTAPWSFTYTVDGLNPVTVSNVLSSPFTLPVSQAGIYSISALSDAVNTGIFFQGSATVNIQPLPTANITSGNASICYGSTANISIDFTGTPPWNFIYTIDNLNPVTVSNVPSSPYLLQASQEGTYRVSVLSDTYFTGTSMIGSATITVNPLPISNITSGNASICAGDTSVISVQLTGTQPWSLVYTINGLNPETITNISYYSYQFSASQAGYYQITSVSDANCTGSGFGNANITVRPLPTSEIISGNVSTCNGEYAMIPIQFTGLSPWSFTFTQDGLNPLSISNVADNPYNLFVIESGNYQLTALTDAYCTGIDLTGISTVSLNTLPTASIISGDKTICTGTFTDINIEFSGIPPFNFTYTVNGTNPTVINDIQTTTYALNVSQPGIYEVVALSDAICSGNVFTGSSTVSIYEQASSIIAATNQTVCPGSTNEISISLTGNAPWNFSYVVPGTGIINVTDNTNNPYLFNASLAGTYEVISLTDAFCSGTNLFGSVSLTENILPTANIISADVSICQGSATDVAVEFTGSAPWTFEYSKDGINPVSVTDINTSSFYLPVSDIGVYTVSALSDANCQGISLGNPVTITAFESPSSAITESNEVICPGTTASLNVSFTGTSPWNFTYTRNGANAVTLNNITQNSVSIPVTSDGTYQVIAVSDVNCTGNYFIGSKAVAYNIPSSNIVSGNALICTGTTTDVIVELLGTAPWTFSYAKDGQPVSTVNNITSNTYFLPVSDEGTYVISALTDSMCAGVYMYGSSTISLKPPPVATIAENNIAVCEGTSANINIDFTGTSPWSFTYTKDGINPVTVTDIYNSNYVLPVTVSGLYEISSLNDANCTTNNIASSAIVNINPLPVVDLGTDIVTCSNNPVTLNAGNGFADYQWSNGTTNQELSVNTSGTYNVQVTDSNGCLNTDEIIVTVNSLPFVNLGSDFAFCQGQSTTIDAGSGFVSYLWNDASTNQTNSVSIAGTYNVQVTDNNGCLNTDEIIVTVNSLPFVNLGSDIAFCQGQSTTLDAGSGFASYLWNDASTNQTNSVSIAGTYNVQITDNNGCINTDEILVTLNSLPVINLGTDITFCEGQSATLDAGIGFVNYLWNDASTNQTLSVSNGGVYNVQVTDNNGCINTDEILVTLNSLPIVNLGTDITFCEGQSATLDAGTGFVNYIWNDASTNQTITVNTGGTYNVQVTDNNGCTNTDEVIVSLSLIPVPSFTYTANSLNVSFTNNSQNANSYLWDFGDSQTSADFSPAHLYPVSGTYIVSLTASNPPCNDSIVSQSIQIIEVGTSNVSFDNTVKIYPNPTGGKVSISLSNNPNTVVQILIYNAIGQEIYTTHLNGANAMKEIELSQHAAGIYNVKIISMNFTKTVKLILNN